MNMTREDIMRELELLPVWQLKQPLATMPFITKPVPLNESAIEPVVETIALQQEVVAPINTQLNIQPVTVQPNVIEVARQEAANTAQLPVPDALVEAPSLAATTPVIVSEKIATPWLLFCPLASAQTEVHTLMHNMIKAMRLLATDFVLVTEASQLAHYQAHTCLVFGLQAAQQYLGLAEHTIEALRGVPHQQVGVCWVTYHPEDLLQNPSLKRAAWQDLCAALAHHAAHSGLIL